VDDGRGGEVCEPGELWRSYFHSEKALAVDPGVQAPLAVLAALSPKVGRTQKTLADAKSSAGGRIPKSDPAPPIEAVRLTPESAGKTPKVTRRGRGKFDNDFDRQRTPEGVAPA
jgi:hypothetical protein